MTDPTSIAKAFVEAWNARDLAAMRDLLHDDFTWHIAVTEPGVEKLRPLQSKLLEGKNLSWEKAIYNKEETLQIFEGIFATTSQFSIKPYSYTAQDDRVAVELVGDAYNFDKNRVYKNLYCYMLQVRDGKLVLFREYQDTLLLFDAWIAD